jgi:hypothetical protein
MSLLRDGKASERTGFQYDEARMNYRMQLSDLRTNVDAMKDTSCFVEEELWRL